MTDFDEFEAAEKAAMAKAERMYKLTINALGIIGGAAVIFMLLYLVAKNSHGAVQDQFTLICNRVLIDSKKRNAK